jgi:hypothetical protein
MNEQLYLDQLESQLLNSKRFGSFSHWIEKHTWINGKRYSFSLRKALQTIADDPAFELVGIKPTQVGFTELIVRIACASCAVLPYFNVMATWPTLWETMRNVKSRVDPVIGQSPTLSSLVAKANDSSTFKMVGSSKMTFSGAQGKPLISVPVDLMIHDEVDFSHPESLASGLSRLEGSEYVDPATGNKGIRRLFSTPTVTGTGVDDLYTQSTRHKYLAKHSACGTWLSPSFLHDCVVDGWDRPFSELRYQDVNDLEGRGLVDTARLLCPGCGEVIPMQELQGGQREWVGEREHFRHGYALSPLDFPLMHSPSTLLRRLAAYKSQVTFFYNFSLGLPFKDETTSVMPDVVAASRRLRPLPPDQARAQGVSGAIIGCDVGDTCYIVVALPEGPKLKVVWIERLQEVKGALESPLVARLEFIFSAYNAMAAGVDLRPWKDTVLLAQSKIGEEVLWPIEYSLSDKALLPVIPNKAAVMQANRTRTLSATAQMINSGMVEFADFQEMDMMAEHLGALNKVQRPAPDGSGVQEEWLGNGDDHYFHAFNYARIVYDHLNEGRGGWAHSLMVPSGVSRVVVGSQVRHLAQTY